MDARVEHKMLGHESPEPGVVAASVYAGGRCIADIAIDEAGKWAKRPGHVVWIGLFEPSYELLARIQAQLGLHDLAIEDAGKAHQHPKIEQYGDALFIVARTAQMVDGGSPSARPTVRRPRLRGLGAPRRLDIVCRRAQAVRGRARRRCRTARTTSSTPSSISSSTTTCRCWKPSTREVERSRTGCSPQPLRPREVQRLYTLRRELLRLRNAVAPLVEVCQRLEHAEVKPIDATMQPLFRDVTDHVNRVKEEIDALREVLAFTFEASLMTGQAQQTAITRRLAAWAAILAVPTAIAGIYGMNFEHMPELKWQYGYYLVLGFITELSAAPCSGSSVGTAGCEPCCRPKMSAC